MAKFTYSNNSSLQVADLGTSHNTIDVYGMGGLVTDVSVGIIGLHQAFPVDYDMLLVAPDGQHNLNMMSDAGTAANGVSFTLTDDAANQVIVLNEGEQYKPTNFGANEDASNWGLSIPSISQPPGATFKSAFANVSSYGNWSLYIHDDAEVDVGGIDGWKLTLTTNQTFAVLDGTTGDDTIQVLNTTTHDGIFAVNDRGGVQFEDVSAFLINAGEGNDLVVAADGNDSISTGAGRDTVYAGTGNDTIYVDAGDDTAGEIYDGGNGIDILNSNALQTLDLRDDTLLSIDGISQLSGGTVQVTAAQVASSGLTSVTGSSGIGQVDVFEVTMGTSTSVDLNNVDFFQFSDDGDLLKIIGDNDAEIIRGSNARSLIKAGGGDDRILSNSGRDTSDGGKGVDRIEYSDRQQSVNVKLDGSHRTSVTIGGFAEDVIKNIENVSGGSGADKLIGDKLDNFLNGNEGNDVLKGGAGADKLLGFLGADTMTGGAGKDQFSFVAVDAVDHIKDFSHADDTIALSIVTFDAFHKLGGIRSKAFHANAEGHEAHTAKQKLIYDKADHSLWYDADGNGAGAAVEVAVFDNKVKNLDFHDFLIV